MINFSDTSPEISEKLPKETCPLLIRCAACGAPSSFDITSQSYRCAHCGADMEKDAPLNDADKWRSQVQGQIRQKIFQSGAAVSSCPNCGARVMVSEGDATSSCDFCGATLARRALLSADQIPEVVIPFVLTLEEAKERLKNFLSKNPKAPGADEALKNMDRLTGYYLPYQLVKGPVDCTISRASTSRNFRCGGFLNGIAINTSSNLDNSVLDAMEPFDWSKARAFDLAYIAGHRTKLPDVNGDELLKRTKEEVLENYRPVVMKEMASLGVTLKVEIPSMLSMPALLPVYVLSASNLQCFVNGQTGRISVSDRTSRTIANKWYIAPTLITVLGSLLAFWGLIPKKDYVAPGLSGFFRTSLIEFFPGNLFIVGVIALFAFGILIRRKTTTTVSNLAFSPPCSAKRDAPGSAVQYVEGRGAVEDSVSPRPIFFEPCGEGQELVPVRISFFRPGLLTAFILALGTFVMLPAILALIVNLVRIALFDAPADLIAAMNFRYGAAWYIISFVAAIGPCLMLLVDICFDTPVIRRILPDGKLKPIESKRDSPKQFLKEILGLAASLWNQIRHPDLITGLLFYFPLFCLLGTTGAIAVVDQDESENAMTAAAAKSGAAHSASPVAASQPKPAKPKISVPPMPKAATIDEWNALPEITQQDAIRTIQAWLESQGIDSELNETGSTLRFSIQQPKDLGKINARVLFHFNAHFLHVTPMFIPSRKVPEAARPAMLEYMAKANLKSPCTKLEMKDETGLLTLMWTGYDFRLEGMKWLPEDVAARSVSVLMKLMKIHGPRLAKIMDGTSTDTDLPPQLMDSQFLQSLWPSAPKQQEPVADAVTEDAILAVQKVYEFYKLKFTLKEDRRQTVPVTAAIVKGRKAEIWFDFSMDKSVAVFMRIPAVVPREKRAEMERAVNAANDACLSRYLYDAESGTVIQENRFNYRGLKSLNAEQLRRMFHESMKNLIDHGAPLGF